MAAALHIGLLVNPLAGLGGSLGLKGSDGDALRERALGAGAEGRRRALERVARAIAVLPPDRVRISTWAGEMGELALANFKGEVQVLGAAPDELSAAADTKQAAARMQDAGVDVLVFGGGDGTARDILDAVGTTLPVLGIPAGVKMHSGVFTVSPEAAGQLLTALASGRWVGLRLQEVRDIDEEAFRHDVVRSRFYGEMQVPGEGHYLQHTKIGGRESQELVAAEIAAWMATDMDDDSLYLLGPGSTTMALKEELGLPQPTLLGVDVWRAGEQLAADADEESLLALLAQWGAAQLVLTAIGGQGHVFGRGNQQFSPAVIRSVGRDNIRLLVSKGKISALKGRPFLVDTNDAALDAELAGYYRVVTGYDDFVLYRVSNDPEEEENHE